MASGKQFSLSFLFNAKKAAGFNKTFAAVNQSIQGIGKSLAGLATAYISVDALKSVASTAVESASSLEGYRATLNVVMKDQEKAAETMAWAVDFANRTPFETDQIVEATVRLQSYGLKAEDVMTQIGDMAGVMGKDIMQAVEAVADAQTGELERMKEFGITKAMIEEKANEMFKKGQVINNKGQIKDQEKFNQALFALMEERFQGGMEIQANSFKGLKSTISGIWKTGLASIAGISNTGEIVAGGLFDRLKDGLKTVADWMQKLADNNAFEKLGVKLGGLIDKAKDGGKKLLDFFGPTFQAIRDAAGKVTDKFNEVKDSIFDMASSVQDKGKSALDWLGNVGLPKAVELLGKAAEKALEFASFISSHWNVILPLIKAVGLAFAGWKIIQTVGGGIRAVKGLASSFRALPAVIAKAAGAEKLANAIKKDGIKFALQYRLALIKEKVALIGHKVAQVASAAASKIAAAAQWLLNSAFLASPITWIVVGILAVVAAGVALYKNWDKVKAFAVSLWEKLKSIFGGIGDWFKGVWDGVVNIFTGAWDKIKGVFSGIGDWFKSIWEGVSNIFKGYVNIYINILNFLIRALNKIQVTLPDWVPFGLGGKTLGFNIPEIPLLAKGGIVTGPTLAGIGEGGEPEAVLPLSKLSRMLGGVGAGGDIIYSPTITITGNADQNAAEQALDVGFEQFKRWYRRLQEERKRVSFSRG